MARKNLKQTMAEALEIPQDIMGNQLRLILRGNQSLTAENHQGIVLYSDCRIIFKSPEGLVDIFGEDLVLLSLENNELMIEGRIVGIKLPLELEEE
ncbi:MAG: YabP/YqfC family sporulation protein [Clostridiales bacterium]